jgi:hypothetical protein
MLTRGADASREVGSPRRLAIVYAGRTGAIDGVRQYSERLTQELGRVDGLDVELWLGRSGVSLLRSRERVQSLDALILQHNPYSFGRGGFAPDWIAALAHLRRAPARPLLAVIVHELGVPYGGQSWGAAPVLRRVQSRLVSTLADVLLSPVEHYVGVLARRHPGRPVYHLPVASNLPSPSGEAPRESETSGSVVLATLALGTNHLRLEGLAVRAAEETASRTGRDVTLLMLGAGVPVPRGSRGQVRIVVPGALPEAELSRRLRSADLFLAPLADGVSARRGTVMAAMQHGLPVVGTAGPLTDELMRRATGVELVPVGEPERFPSVVADLAAAPERLARLGAEARRFYDAELDWPVMVDRLLGHLSRHLEERARAHA